MEWPKCSMINAEPNLAAKLNQTRTIVAEMLHGIQTTRSARGHLD